MKNLLRWLQGSERPPVQHERAEPFFIFGALQLPFFGADLYNVAWHDADYGIHLTLLLLAVVSSSVMSIVLRSWLRRSMR